MSNYTIHLKHKPTNEVHEIFAIDNYFGNRDYGYKLPDGDIYNQYELEAFYYPRCIMLELRIEPQYFAPILSGEKTFEVCDTIDREFYVGQGIILREWCPENGYTSRQQKIRVTHVCCHMQRDSVVVFSFVKEG